MAFNPKELGAELSTAKPPLETGVELEVSRESVEASAAAPEVQISKTEQPVAKAPVTMVPVATSGAPKKEDDVMVKEIEGLLSENLEKIYQELSPEKKATFRAKGEKLAKDIKSFILAKKMDAYKILKSIKDWLKSIPNISQWFLIQESKIKLDKVLDFADVYTKAHNNTL